VFGFQDLVNGTSITICPKSVIFDRLLLRKKEIAKIKKIRKKRKEMKGNNNQTSKAQQIGLV
jgi:hypothetical protein